VNVWSIVVNHFRPPATHVPPHEVRSLSERRARVDRAGAAPGRRLGEHRLVALRAAHNPMILQLLLVKNVCVE